MSCFGTRLRQLRVSKRMTQQELAEALQLARNTIAMYERGEREPCHVTTQKIAETLGTTTDYLLGCTDLPLSAQPACWQESSVARAISERLGGMSESDLKEILAFVEFKQQQAKPRSE